MYRLIRNTGPLPPVVKTFNCVYDPNTDEIHTDDMDLALEKMRKRYLRRKASRRPS